MSNCLHCLQMFVTGDKQQNTDNQAENEGIEGNVCQFAALMGYSDDPTKPTNRQTHFKNWPNGP